MTILVPYASDETIEKDAQTLLAEFALARSVSIEPPIPLDDIVEKHLRIGMEFDDMHRLLDVPRFGIDPDILGAIFFNEKRIVIDESLDPVANPAKEGRFRYTAAHEVGHWRLHRRLFERDRAQASLLDGNASPSVICRSSQAKERIEVQADLYASCLLMPRCLVLAAWRRLYGSTSPFVHSVHMNNPKFMRPRSTWVNLGQVVAEAFGGSREPDLKSCFDRIARPISMEFGVSTTAMRIRLEKLGLLLRTPPQQRSLEGFA